MSVKRETSLVLQVLHISGPSTEGRAAIEAGLQPPDYCCMGAVMRGPGGCYCWEPEFDLRQQSLQEGPMSARANCCGDCAFRNGSPERESDRLVFSERRIFACHQGVRRAIRYHHPEGLTVDAADPGDYRPPERGGRVWLADGRPGEVCAGWAAYADVRGVDREDPPCL